MPASEPHALRLAIPREGETVIHDVVRGDVMVSHAELDDWILVRTDGTPTYNFCVVVDDVTMKITHVIRGNDHLSNTPKQLLCYEALGYPVPVFAHISMILARDKTRLSKRHGATSVLAFREMGMLPEAMVNYLARLGWSHGDQEIFTPDELIEHFDLARVGAADAVFDQEKLTWVNHQWIKRLPAERVARELEPFLARAGLPPARDTAWLGRVVETLRERARTLVEMAEQATFYFKAPRPTTRRPPPSSGRSTPRSATGCWSGGSRPRRRWIPPRWRGSTDSSPPTSGSSWWTWPSSPASR